MDINNSNNLIISALNNKSDIDLGNTILDDTINESNNKPVSGASVYQEINKLIDSAPETLDTLNKLAQAINNDPNFFTTINNLLNLKANDTTVVHKTGNESIDGIKTFTNSLIIDNKENKISALGFRNNNVILGTPPNEDSSSTIYFLDNDPTSANSNNAIGVIRGVYTSDGSTEISLNAHEPIKNSNNSSTLKVIYSSNGETYALGPSTRKIPNKNEIVTVDYLNNNTVRKSEDESISGTKTFTNTINGNISGNAATSTKLQTARTISLTGDVTCSGSFDGSKNFTMNTSLSASGVNEGNYGSTANTTLVHGGTFIVPYFSVNSKGRVTVAKNITLTLPTDTNTDTKVTQTVTTTNAEYALLAMADASATATKTNGARFSSAVTLNPSTKKITCTGLSGTTPKSTWVDAAKSGGSLVDYPDISDGAFAPFVRYKTTNGAFVVGGFKSEFGFYYLTDTNIDADTNTVAETVKINENGVLSSTGGFSGNLSGTASKATSDSLGQNIADTYIKGLSVSGTTITITKGDGGTSTIKTQDTNTDTKVTQTVTTTNAEYPILATTDAKKTSTSTTTARFDSSITLNPGTNTITADTFKGNLSGNAATATKATQDSSGNNIVNTYATKNELNNLSNKIMPVGSIYVQYPSQSDPTTLFGGTWSNISSTYAGRFFRAEGGSAAAFGSNQNGGLPNIEGQFSAIRYSSPNNVQDVIQQGCMKTIISFKNLEISGGNTSGSCEFMVDSSKSSSLYGASTEVRPINSTIRIWKRTK